MFQGGVQQLAVKEMGGGNLSLQPTSLHIKLCKGFSALVYVVSFLYSLRCSSLLYTCSFLSLSVLLPDHLSFFLTTREKSKGWGGSSVVRVSDGLFGDRYAFCLSPEVQKAEREMAGWGKGDRVMERGRVGFRCGG